MNRTSSRSHAICRLQVVGTLRHTEGDAPHDSVSGGTDLTVDGSSMSCGQTTATLTLCDLAGSEVRYTPACWSIPVRLRS